MNRKPADPKNGTDIDGFRAVAIYQSAKDTRPGVTYRIARYVGGLYGVDQHFVGETMPAFMVALGAEYIEAYANGKAVPIA